MNKKAMEEARIAKVVEVRVSPSTNIHIMKKDVENENKMQYLKKQYPNIDWAAVENEIKPGGINVE